MKTSSALATLRACLFTLLAALAGCQDATLSPAPTSPASPAPGNVVQTEMRLLSATLEGAVRGIGAGDVRSVALDLHRVHAAKQATEAAIVSGTYRLPKHPDAVARFHELDEAFHRGLRQLVDASARNDVAATAAAIGVVLGECQGCHAEFRP
jgi:cytochrome c556